MTYTYRGTTPARPERKKPGRKPQPFNTDRCGERAGYKRHLRHGIPPCDPCRAANTTHCQQYQESPRNQQ